MSTEVFFRNFVNLNYAFFHAFRYVWKSVCWRNYIWNLGSKRILYYIKKFQYEMLFYSYHVFHLEFVSKKAFCINMFKIYNTESKNWVISLNSLCLLKIKNGKKMQNSLFLGDLWRSIHSPFAFGMLRQIWFMAQECKISRKISRFN